MSGFFLWTLLQNDSKRCVRMEFDLQSYSSPVLWRWFSMYPHVSKLVSTTRIFCKFVQWSSSRHSFMKMLWRTLLKHSCDNRPQQVIVFRAKMRVVRRNTFIARRGETTALLLFFVAHLSDLRVRSHHSQPGFFGAKSYQEKEISRDLIDCSMHALGFDTSNPSWVEHRRMQRCGMATPPLFFYSTTP